MSHFKKWRFCLIIEIGGFVLFKIGSFVLLSYTGPSITLSHSQVLETYSIGPVNDSCDEWLASMRLSKVRYDLFPLFSIHTSLLIE